MTGHARWIILTDTLLRPFRVQVRHIVWYRPDGLNTYIRFASDGVLVRHTMSEIDALLLDRARH